MSRALPADKKQIAIFKKHGKLKPAADEIGIHVATLRWRLIAWKVYKSKGIQCVGGCGRVARTGNDRCHECQKKEDAAQRMAERAAEKLTEMEVSKAAPPRYYDCRFYEKCLNGAAVANDELKCNGCGKYWRENL